MTFQFSFLFVSYCYLCADISIYVCRDHKSYAKYSAVDSEIDQRVCQDVISGDSVILKGKKAMFEDLISEQRAVLDSEEVCVYYLLLLILHCHI